MSNQNDDHLAPRPDRSLSVHPAWRQYPLLGSRLSKSKLPDSDNEEEQTPVSKQKKSQADYNLKYAAELSAKFATQKIRIAKSTRVLERLTDMHHSSTMQTVLSHKKCDGVPNIEGLFIVNSNGLHIAPGAGPEQRQNCYKMLDDYVNLYGENPYDLE